GDAAQPGAHGPPGGVEIAPPAIGDDEGLLGDLVGQGPIAAEAVGVGDEPAVVLADHRLEVALARLELRGDAVSPAHGEEGVPGTVIGTEGTAIQGTPSRSGPSRPHRDAR